MAHVHSHSHSHPSRSGVADAGLRRAYVWGIGLNTAIVIVEAAAGAFAGSLALLADAGHNAGDVLGLLLAWGASLLARGGATERRTYGLRRSSILAALLNATLLLVAVGGIAWEAVLRLMKPEPVASGIVIAVAAAGIVVNSLGAWLFHRTGSTELNARSAYLHLLGDAGVSLGVVAAGIGIHFTGWQWLDPAASLVVGVAILVGTWGLFRDALDLALDAVPAGIDVGAVRGFLAAQPAIAGVHDLHVWGMSTTEVALTAHLVVPGERGRDQLLAELGRELRERFGIAHATIQIESGVCESAECEPPAPRKSSIR
ncbi:MAG: cation diffusion facilitator family transporter [Acidobacteriota bacterium]